LSKGTVAKMALDHGEYWDETMDHGRL